MGTHTLTSNSVYLSKLAIGTAQFGSDYGIANSTGKVTQKKIQQMLAAAFERGITSLDTAYSYGTSEEELGKAFAALKRPFKVMTKLALLNNENNLARIQSLFFDSMKKLDIQQAEAVLIHHFSNYQKCHELLDFLVKIKKDGLTKRIGFSLYTTEDLEIILNNRLAIDVIQIPYSLFDRRFEPYFTKLSKLKIELHCRSVFLQGLAFLDAQKLKGNLAKAKPQIMEIEKLKGSLDQSVASLFLNFAVRNSFIQKVVVGMDGLEQFEQNVKDIVSFSQYDFTSLDSLKIEDEDVLLPYNWKLS